MSDTYRNCGLGSFIGFCIALALFIIGFGAPYWMTGAREYQGLWRYCFVDYNLCENFVGNNALMVPVPDNLRGAQALMSLALLSGIAAALCFMAWITDNDYRAPAAAVFFTLLTGGLDAGGVAVYASYYGTPTGWAFWMCAGSAPIFLVTGLLTLCTVCQGEDTINRHDYTPEMMYESMHPDKRPLMPIQPPSPSRFKDPPIMEFPNPAFDGRGQPQSPLEKHFPAEAPPLQQKPPHMY